MGGVACLTGVLCEVGVPAVLTGTVIAGAGWTIERKQEVKPLDQVVRDRIAPVLKGAGFKKEGRLFILENEGGDRAAVEVRQYRLGRHDAEFFIDLDIQPRVWHNFMAHRGIKTHGGIWSDRLRVPGRPVGRIMSDQWSFDLDDEEAGRQLSETMAAALPGLLHLLDVKNLLAHVRATASMTSRPSVKLAALLSTQGPSEELEQLLSALEQEHPEGFDAAGFVAFLRAWMAEHAPSRQA